MPKFGSQSRAILATVNPVVRELFEEVVKGFDCKPTCGLRSEREQKDLYAIGRTTHIGQPTVTKLDGVVKKSRHQSGDAIDICPYPINWKDINRFYFFAGYVKRVAEEMDIDVIWGGDWDGDTQVSDQSFNDLPHWELRK